MCRSHSRCPSPTWRNRDDKTLYTPDARAGTLRYGVLLARWCLAGVRPHFRCHTPHGSKGSALNQAGILDPAPLYLDPTPCSIPAPPCVGRAPLRATPIPAWQSVLSASHRTGSETPTPPALALPHPGLADVYPGFTTESDDPPDITPNRRMGWVLAACIVPSPPGHRGCSSRRAVRCG